MNALSWIWRTRHTVIGIVITAVMLFPLYWMVNVSLQSGEDLFRRPPSWFPIHPDFSGYRSAFSSQSGHLVTSIIAALGTVVVTLILAIPAAFAMTNLRLRFVTPIVLFTLLVTQMIPTIVLAQGLYGIFVRLGLLNTYTALILADTTHALPFAILLLRAFMSNLPRELIDAARVDGANFFQAMIKMAIPLSRNGIVTTALFSFLFAWGDFLYAVTISTRDSIVPVTVGMYLFIGEQVAQDFNALMATAVMACIPAGIILVFAQRYISAGLTAGAVKE